MQNVEQWWLVEYSAPGVKKLNKEYFGSREEAEAYMEGLPDGQMATVYQVDEDGRPVFDALSNFNLK